MSDTKDKAPGPSPSTTLTGYEPSAKQTRPTERIPPLDASMTSDELRRSMEERRAETGEREVAEREAAKAAEREAAEAAEDDDIVSVKFDMVDETQAAVAHTLTMELRRPAPLAMPRQPFPLDEPYAHPALFGGREGDVANCRRMLRMPVPIIGLHGAPTVGKTSLLQAGLVPDLRARGYPVSFLRLPVPGNLGARLIGEVLVQSSPGGGAQNQDDGSFVDLLCAAQRLSGRPVILIVDQLEEVLDGPQGEALAGLLRITLKVKLQPRPFHWLLCFQSSHQAAVRNWLGDFSSSRFVHFSELAPLGAPSDGGDPLEDAASAFQAAIVSPFMTSLDGRRAFPYRFAADGAERLARAFARARLARPSAPLTSVLQAVMAQLLSTARPVSDGSWMIEVPPRPDLLIEQTAAFV